MLYLYALRLIALMLCLGCGVRTPGIQSSSGGARAGTASPATVRDDSITVAAMEQRVETAAVRRDVGFLDSVLAPTFRFTHAGGTVQTRAALLGQFGQAPSTTGTRTIARDVDSLSVEMHHNTALTSGIIHVSQCMGTLYRGYTVRFIRVYRRAEPGRWQLLSHRTIGPTQPDSAPPAGGPPANDRCS